MKLELKHLAPYLPYGLKAIDAQTNEIRLVTLLHFTYDLQTVGHNHLIYEGLILRKHKPILRPLSDLIKEIEIDGDKFIPHDRLMLGLLLKLPLKYNNRGVAENRIVTNTIAHTDWMMCIQWHFDVFGLIDKGLAIDSNTLVNQST